MYLPAYVVSPYIRILLNKEEIHNQSYYHIYNSIIDNNVYQH